MYRLSKPIDCSLCVLSLDVCIVLTRIKISHDELHVIKILDEASSIMTPNYHCVLSLFKVINVITALSIQGLKLLDVTEILLYMSETPNV